jgi:AraC-like DNA-binding protein
MVVFLGAIIFLMNLDIGFYLFCILIAMANLLLTAMLLLSLRKARNLRANRILAAALLLLGASFMSDVLWRNGFFDHYPHFFEYDTLLSLCIGPLVYLYIRYQINPSTRLQPPGLLHLLPVLLWVWLMRDFLFSSTWAKLEMINNLAIPNFLFVQYLKKAQLLFYGLLCYRLLVRHRRVTRELLSNLESRQLLWLQDFLFGAGVLFGVFVISNEVDWAEPALGLTLLGFSYWVAYHSVQQESSFAHVATETILSIIEEEPAVRYRNSTLTQEYLLDVVKKIESHMAERKPYLDGELTLTSLAGQLEINPNQLSQILNEGLGENFYRFVNRYRVEESKRLLLDPAFNHYNILGIAFQAGFSTKSTFNKTFKELTGLSPSEFVKQNRSGENKKGEP